MMRPGTLSWAELTPPSLSRRWLLSPIARWQHVRELRRPEQAHVSELFDKPAMPIRISYKLLRVPIRHLCRQRRHVSASQQQSGSTRATVKTRRRSVGGRRNRGCGRDWSHHVPGLEELRQGPARDGGSGNLGRRATAKCHHPRKRRCRAPFQPGLSTHPPLDRLHSSDAGFQHHTNRLHPRSYQSRDAQLARVVRVSRCAGAARTAHTRSRLSSWQSSRPRRQTLLRSRRPAQLDLLGALGLHRPNRLPQNILRNSIQRGVNYLPEERRYRLGWSNRHAR